MMRESYLGMQLNRTVSQKKMKYQSCGKLIATYNAENRSVCQRSGFFVSETQ